jgi:DNA polymerase-3 subunit alpha
VELVATNDVHYLAADDAEAHEILLCINTGKFFDDAKRLSFTSAEYYFKSPAEMAERFRHLPEAVRNTRRVAEACNLELFFDEKHLPTFHADAGGSSVPILGTKAVATNDELFERLCREGLSKRYGESPAAEVTHRFEREVGVIRRMGFVSFFLVAWDLVKKARELGVPVGPGRGSAAGSIVSYCLEITSVDPVRYELIFERFMDETRGEAPDIDIDFCQEGREKVLEYVRGKYGNENVAQIITFGTMAARGVIRDVARVLRYPLDQTDRLAKMVPAALNITLNSALKDSPDLASAYEHDPQVKRIIDTGKRLEGLARHASTHAAGVVLADRPLREYVPLARISDEVTTQYAMESLEKVGLVKMDLLGLKTLTVLDRALGMIRRRHGVEIDLNALDLDDAPTYEMLSRGESMGVFQFESSGFRDLLTRMKPDRFADLIACVALYRPGPLGGGMVDDYVERKHKKEAVEFPHPILEQVLRSTYGVMVYQEQVMRIVNLLGGIPMSESYTLIKAISKKRKDYIEAMRERFIEGAVKNGFDEEKAEKLFEQITFFGGYGFNQSHSTAYALVAFQTAYLKCHYAKEFLAALMSHEMADSDKLKLYVDECRQAMGIDVLPPDVNESEPGFSVIPTESGPGIRFALAAAKGVGERAAQNIFEARRERRFESLFDFCSRVDLRLVNKGVIEALIKCGAFDSLGGKRAQYLAVLDRAIGAGTRIQADRQSGQASFFDPGEGASDAGGVRETLPAVPEWNEQEILAAEKEAIGFYLTTHPLVKRGPLLARFANASAGALREYDDGTELTLGVMLSRIRFTLTKKGERMAFMNLEDLSGRCDSVIFPSDLARYEPLIRDEEVVFVRGKLDLRRETPSIIIGEIVPLAQAPLRLTESVTLRLDAAHQEPTHLEGLRGVLIRHHGNTGVYLDIERKGEPQTQLNVGGPPDSIPLRGTKVRADSSFSVTPDDLFAADVRRLLGEDALKYNPVGPRKQSARNEGRSRFPSGQKIRNS